MQAELALPVFSNIDISKVEAQLDAIITANREKIEVLCELEAVNWQNFALPMQAMDMVLEDFWSPIGHLNGVQNSDELRDVYQACVAKITQYSSELGQHAALFKQFKALASSDEFTQFTAAEKSWVEKALRDFTLSGIDLAPDQQQRFKEISARLAELSQQFSNNVLDATADWTKHLEAKAVLKGLPEGALALLKQSAQQREKEGYLLTLDFPAYHAVITYAESRSLRKEIYMAYMCKASEQAENTSFDNSPIMVEILALKNEAAQLLGFEHYAQRSLATKMANDVSEVTTFLIELAEKSRGFAELELETLQVYARKELGLKTLEAWDMAYVGESYKQKHYAINDEVLREYFPLHKVLAGMFDIVGRLFDIEISEQNDVDCYHEDVRFFQISQQGTVIAGFYLDLFAREKKRGGAWMADCRSRWLNESGEQSLPVAFLTCNFRQATGDTPALLAHNEVTTLFHEFGHGLHHMLTQENVAGVSGIAGVEWDAVELPSQFLENWCWEKESLALISEHYDTQEPLPEALLDSLLKAKKFNAGMMMLRQIEFSLFDFVLHCLGNVQDAEQIQEVLEQVRDQVAVVYPPEEVRFQHGFGHIFAGGYAAGYYSYKWAEVLSADAFSLFEEKGLFDKAAGQAFLQEVLQVGSARPAAESFAAFRGRAPSTDALLRHSGLAA